MPIQGLSENDLPRSARCGGRRPEPSVSCYADARLVDDDVVSRFCVVPQQTGGEVMRKRYCWITVLVLVLATGVQANVVVDRPPSQSGAWPSDTAYPAWGAILSQRVADSFTIKAPAVIRQIKWWGNYWPATPPTTELMQIRVHSTHPTSGLPGAVLLDTAVLNPARTPTGLLVTNAPWTLNTFPEYAFQAELATPLSLDPNTPYWLEIAQVGDNHSGFIWELSSVSQSRFAFANPSDAPWELASSGSNLAFQLSTVPEPTIVALVIAGIHLVQRKREVRL